MRGLAALVPGLVALPLAAQPALYEMSTETGMPHLEWNLRYATVTERRCLDPQDLSGVFWMLREPALQDCTMVPEGRSAGRASYRLLCRGGHGTEGSAEWRIGPDTLDGRLDVRLGGKNMTFYQRVVARVVGPC